MSPRPVQLRADLTADEWRRLRAACALDDTTPRELATALLLRWLADFERKAAA
jgi:hypothetical protein